MRYSEKVEKILNKKFIKYDGLDSLYYNDVKEYVDINGGVEASDADIAVCLLEWVLSQGRYTIGKAERENGFTFYYIGGKRWFEGNTLIDVLIKAVEE